MNAQNISIGIAGRISSSSRSNEQVTGAGNITITASEVFQSSGGGVESTTFNGSGGDITIHGGGILLANGATLSASGTGSGPAGSIQVTSDGDITVRNSLIETSSVDSLGGNIKLKAPHLIRLVDSRLTSSVQGPAGSNGGNINIDPLLVVIQSSQIFANANGGAAGNINITATGAVLVDPNSTIQALAGSTGINGSVNINAPIQILSGALVPLNLAYSQAGLSGDRCAADPQGQFSSFVQTGRDGVPQVPGALSPSPLSFMEPLTSGSLKPQVPSLAAARFGLGSVSFDNSPRFQFHSACRS
jgi:large exoprotein involved in heme utilization and adhesion